MGLDIVEVVVECERTFKVKLEDDRLSSMRTVGELFELICEQLGLPVGTKAPVVDGELFVTLKSAPSGGWDRTSLWVRLVRLVTDQLQVHVDDVRYHARFNEDLGAD